MTVSEKYVRNIFTDFENAFEFLDANDEIDDEINVDDVSTGHTMPITDIQLNNGITEHN